MRSLGKLNKIQATLAFLLSAAYRKHFGHKMLVIEHSLPSGYFCHRDDWEPPTRKNITALEQQMQAWLNSDTPVELAEMPLKEVQKKFHNFGLSNKPAVLDYWQPDPVPIIKFNKYWDYRFKPMCTDKTELQNFSLLPFQQGLILAFPSLTHPEVIPTLIDCPKLFSIIEEYRQWGTILGIENIPQLNEHIRENGMKELIWVAEGLHEKKISSIAEELSAGFLEKRVVFIAGPSSSGKTTFAKRLAIHLQVNGYTTRQISMDDYFIDRDAIPTDENGLQDFEAFEVLNSKLLVNRIDRLLAGAAVPIREYNFNTGKGADLKKTFALRERDFIILEGIHGLNPKLTNETAGGNVQKIYASAITQLNIDGDHRVSTSDNRLIRRLVRDHKFRSYSPAETLGRWESVRLGEERNIFPFQEEADFMFNSALIYELPVLSQYALDILSKFKGNTNCSQEEALRLSTFLSFFEPLPEDYVPGISILREFIGGSEFHY